MPRATNKRKEAEEGSSDETPPVRQNKTRRTSGNTVKFAHTVQAVSFGEYQQPKSILKTRSEPFPIAPGSPNTARSPSPEPSKEFEEEEFDREEVDTMRKLAEAAINLARKARKEQLEHGLAAVQKELAFTKNDLENVRFSEKIYMQSTEKVMQSRDKLVRALADADKRTETARAEVKEALLAQGKSENKSRALELQLKRADEQVEKLQQELAVIREKEEKGKLLGKKTAMEKADGGNGDTK
ncbi:hypothetical protein HO173_008092 [Letharia columbiana]|uniref:Uncharacterized protein n=1 Tax=Letharia columbiana TaxID=112416 RepID=A0A8H6FSH0_9LECA|nr:uncharacterized protein HO173_008092 [Letharia columbiana]KAF6233880.1 hypothetical protein HO173_008092 [Letharia columbiana]